MSGEYPPSCEAPKKKLSFLDEFLTLWIKRRYYGPDGRPKRRNVGAG